MSRFLTSVLILIVVAAGLFLGLRFWQSERSISPVQIAATTPSTPLPHTADAEIVILMVEKGKVELTQAGNKTVITDEHTVVIGDHIKTLADSTGMLIFPDNDVLRLAANTEITLVAMTASAHESTVMIEQTTGSSWSHVSSLLDRKRQYQIETPTLVATVRGTIFNVSVESAQESWVGVNESQVEVMRKSDQNRVSLSPGQFAWAQSTNQMPFASKKMDSTKMSSVWFKENIEKDKTMKKMMLPKDNKPMKKYFLQENRNLFLLKAFPNSVLPRISSSTPISPLHTQIIDIPPTIIPSSIVNPTPSASTTPSPSTTPGRSTSSLPFPTTSPSPSSQPSTTPLSPVPSSTRSPSTSATSSPNAPTITPTATTSQSPSVSPSATTRPTIRFIPNNNFTNFHYFTPTPTQEPIR